MALRNLSGIVERLRAAGRPAEEPVAFIRNATTSAQEVIETTLESCVDVARGLAAPGLVVVGPVVKLRGGLDWLGALAGRTLDPVVLAPLLDEAPSE
jgi:uroporphyrin-III C-methyltransferase